MGSQAHFGTEWAIFGNGNSTYSNSYNGAAKRIQTLLTQGKAKFLLPNYFHGDTAIEDPPWAQLEQWLQDVSIQLGGSSTQEPTGHYQSPSGRIASYPFNTSTPATITSCTLLSSNIRRLVLNVEKAKRGDFVHAEMLVPNRCTDVKKVLKAFGLSGREVVGPGSSPLTTQEVMTHFVDLKRPFTHTRWSKADKLNYQDEKALLSWPILKTSELFHGRWQCKIDPTALCGALPLSRPRHFSIASSKFDKTGEFLEFLVKCQRNGRFSSEFLSTATTGTSLRIRFAGTSSLSMIEDYSKPIIAFATGSGISSVKYILQQRFRQSLNHATSQEEPILKPSTTSLFVGFRSEDAHMVSDALHNAIRSNMVDILSLTPSNPEKSRAQDKVFDIKFRNIISAKIRDESCYVFVCASPQAAKGFSSNLSALIGRNVRDALGERYIEEVFEAA
ncbi:uncharacterized protein N0V89_004888 [Didymosphaeria variabile]|uniref:NADPH--hemoprotein reductase n=1 Tax=Didymosphaeria variabile TaxID=1932322 RepID=A0A9W8XS32_9PLEO|nr:uncharacterized protein N0V89_004888 [Didymosphaeria variabile]KAJ4356851.1 hypothetical protein N0V89_004888 [Didymosphaeria variabile]